MTDLEPVVLKVVVAVATPLLFTLAETVLPSTTNRTVPVGVLVPWLAVTRVERVTGSPTRPVLGLTVTACVVVATAGRVNLTTLLAVGNQTSPFSRFARTPNWCVDPPNELLGMLKESQPERELSLRTELNPKPSVVPPQYREPWPWFPTLPMWSPPCPRNA